MFHHLHLYSCIPASAPPPPLVLSASLTFRSESAVTTSFTETTASGESLSQHLVLVRTDDRRFSVSDRTEDTEELTIQEPALSSSQDGPEGETHY